MPDCSSVSRSSASCVEDYETCSVALGRKMATQSLQREYQALRLRLETEMLRFLHEDAARSIGRK